MKKNLHEITSSVVSLFIQNIFIIHKNNRIKVKRIV